MPNFIRFAPVICADSIAASPRKTARPLPNLRAIPCALPAADIGLLSGLGIRSCAVSASFMNAILSDGPFND